MKKLIDNLFEIELDQPLDTSGMFDVYLTDDAQHKGKVIIKILKEEFSKDEAVVKRFHRYYSDFQVNVKSLKHLVKIPKTGGVAGEVVYMIQEFIDGQTLDEYIKNNPDIRAADFVPIFVQICDGLHNLHLRNLAHYKLLSKNIMITKDKNNEIQVKITGFGSLYCILDNSRLLELVKHGLESSIAPEILSEEGQGSATTSCDIFSLGQIIRNLPFKIDEDILTKAIDPDPLKRYGKIRDLADESQKLFSDREKVVEQGGTDPGPGPSLNNDEDEFIRSLPDQLPLKTTPRDNILIIPLGKELGIPVSSSIRIEILNKPDKAKLSDGIFAWTPTESKDYQIKIRVFNGSAEKEIIVPVKVKQVISEWKIKTEHKVKAGQVVKFNTENPNPKLYKIVLEQKPDKISGISYNEKSGDFEWKPDNSSAGRHKFQFKKFEILNPLNSTVKDVLIDVEEVITRPEKPDHKPEKPEPKPEKPSPKPEKPAPKPEKPAPKPDKYGSESESDFKKLLRSFSWEYNWPVFIGLAIVVIMFGIDLLIGFGSLIAVECVYLLIAANNSKFQEYLKNRSE